MNMYFIFVVIGMVHVSNKTLHNVILQENNRMLWLDVKWCYWYNYKLFHSSYTIVIWQLLHFLNLLKNITSFYQFVVTFMLSLRYIAATLSIDPSSSSLYFSLLKVLRQKKNVSLSWKHKNICLKDFSMKEMSQLFLWLQQSADIGKNYCKFSKLHMWSVSCTSPCE